MFYNLWSWFHSQSLELRSYLFFQWGCTISLSITSESVELQNQNLRTYVHQKQWLKHHGSCPLADPPPPPQRRPMGEYLWLPDCLKVVFWQFRFCPLILFFIRVIALQGCETYLVVLYILCINIFLYWSLVNLTMTFIIPLFTYCKLSSAGLKAP